MSEVKNAFKRMAVYYLLLAINIIPCASIIPDSFPTRNLSTIYLLFLSVCLVLYYSNRVSGEGALSRMMKSLSWMGLIFILLRGIKYSAFAEVGVLARHTWYLYYVPMLLLPLFLLYISLLMSSKENARIPKGWMWTAGVTAVFIVLVLTNDLHQLIFVFNSNFENWDNDYSYGFLFYAVSVWQYLLYFGAIAILVIKCRISSARKNVWIILIPVAIGLLMNGLLISGKMPKVNGTHIIEFPEAQIFSVAIILECCIQLGLIPTNTEYGKLFRKFSISAQITNKEGKPVYSSLSATALTDEQFAMADGTRIGEHTVLHKMPIPGGFGFWQDDLTQLDCLNDELEEAKENLAQETELIRLRSELKEKQTKIEQRTIVYDDIAKKTQRQSQLISNYAKAARLSNDPEIKEEYRKRITLLGAYIKRYANLMLLSYETGVIEAGELGLSVSEVLHYLNYYSVPCELICTAECTIPSSSALAVFEAFEMLLETNYSSFSGVLVNISENDETLLFKLNIESSSDEIILDALNERLAMAGVLWDAQKEDGVNYICFTLKKGGGAK